MTTTLPRAVVEQALEALEKTIVLHDPMRVSAITALRAALAQRAEPVEPVAVFDERMGRPALLPGAPMLRDGQSLYTAPPQRPPLTEGALMGAYIDFDRKADKSWSSAEYLLAWGRAAIECANGMGEQDAQV